MNDSDLKEREDTSAEALESQFGNQFSDDEKSKFDALGDNDTPANDDEIPYSEEGAKRSGLRGFFTKKKAAAGGGGALAIGLIFGTLTISQGPGQLIHAGELLSRFHFASDSSFMDGRTGKLIRKIRTRNSPERRNLGHLGNIGADHFQRKLTKAGIEQNYSSKFGTKGTLESITIDPNTPAGSRVRAELNAAGFDTSINGPGKITIPVDGVSPAKTKGVITTITRSAGMDGVSGFMSKRLLKKRAGYISMFHPLKRLAAKGDIKFANWLDELKKRNKGIREKGAEVPPEFSPGPDANGKAPAAPDTAAANDVGGTIKSARSEIQGIVPREKVSFDFKAKISKIAGFIGVATVFCGIDKLGDELPKLKHANLVLPLIRTGMTIVTMGSQIKYGTDTFSLDEIRAATADLYKSGNTVQAGSASKPKDPYANTSFFSDASIQTELGQPVTGIDSMANHKPSTENPAVFKVVDAIVTKLGGKRVCRALTSTIGGYVGDAVDIGLGVFTGGGSAALAVAGVAAGYAGSALFMDDIVGWLVGSPINVIAQGAELGGIANFGVALAARDASASHGGIDLSRAQAAALDEDRIHNEKLEMQHKSLFARYFDVKDSQSLVARTLFENQTVASLARPSSMFTNMMAKTNLFSVVGSVFSSLTPKAHAVPEYDYGFAKKGFTLEEINDPAYDDPYAIADEVEPQLTTLNEKYGKCFNMTVDPSTGVLTSGDDVVHLDGQPPECTNRSDTVLTKYRFYLADKTAQRSVECFEGLDDASCSEVGFGDTGTPTPPPAAAPTPTLGTGTGLTGACAPGTKDLGIPTDPAKSAWQNGSPIQARLCSISIMKSSSPESQPGSQFYIEGADGNTIVNAEASFKFFPMITAALADGIPISSFSSFRTMAHQQSLAAKQSDRSLVATPGFSNHQSGQAIDFQCSGSTEHRGDKCFTWMTQNAGKYGILNYPRENWHWSTTGR